MCVCGLLSLECFSVLSTFMLTTYFLMIFFICIFKLLFSFLLSDLFSSTKIHMDRDTQLHKYTHARTHPSTHKHTCNQPSSLHKYTHTHAHKHTRTQKHTHKHTQLNKRFGMSVHKNKYQEKIIILEGTGEKHTLHTEHTSIDGICFIITLHARTHNACVQLAFWSRREFTQHINYIRVPLRRCGNTRFTQ